MQNRNKEIEFKCKRCGECCRQAGFVYLTPEEAVAISEKLRRDIYSFMQEYVEIQDRRKLVLKKNTDESCVFLDGKGCSVYSVRPQQCRDFPLLWRTERSESYCEGLRGCNGID